MTVQRPMLEPYERRAQRRRAVIDGAIAELCTIARADPDIREIIVFGSAAAGRVAPTSDLDVLVVRETVLPRSRRADDILVQVRARVGIDMIVVTPGERRDVLPATSFGRTILDTGRRVYAA